MIAVVILSVLIIGFGIYGYYKREALYVEYEEYFGPVKAFFFVIFLVSGLGVAVSGIASLFMSDINPEPMSIIVGLAFFAAGILMALFTQKKANENGEGNVLWPMFVAGFGTYWKIELMILKFVFFFWLFYNLFKRDDD